MNNRKTLAYQMLTIRNSTASDARMRAAHTIRAGVSPDGDIEARMNIKRFWVAICFVRTR